MLSQEDLLRRHFMWQEVKEEIRTFFKERGFLEVDTPILTRFPGMEPNLDPFETTVVLHHPKREYLLGLRTSPEYAMKQLVASGMKKIFTFAPVFRNQEAYGGNHLPEFTMLEWYAPGDYEDLIKETEELFTRILGSYVWRRIPYRNASFDEYGEPHVKEKAYFITEYPKEEASLARLSKEGFAERLEAFFEGQELCNGFCELTDAKEQRNRFLEEQQQRKEAGKTVFPISEGFLESLEKQTKPFYGNAVGLDRLVMVKYGIKDIKEIQLFPNWFEETES